MYRWRPQSVESNSPLSIELPAIPGKPVVAILPIDSMSSDPDTGFLADVFDFQDNITNQIVAAIEVHLSDGEQVLNWRQEAGDSKAYELFLSARAAYKEYSRAGNARARQGYEAALAVSSQFSSAIVGLARTHIENASFGWSEDRAASEAEAKRLLDTALGIRENHAMAHAELGHLLMVQGDFEAARKQSLRAVANDPNLADAHDVLATVLVCLGQHQEALKFSRQSLQLNPGSPEFYLIAMAEAYVALSRYHEAVPVIQRIISQRPNWIMARASLVIAYQGLGQPDRSWSSTCLSIRWSQL